MPEVPEKTYKRLTADELRRIGEALDTTGGHRANAATMLGVSEERIRNAVLNTPWLKAKWGTKFEEGVPASEIPADELHRDPSPVNPAELASAIATMKEDQALIKNGWGKLGYTPQEVEFMQHLQLQYASNLKGTMDLAYGGSAHAVTRLLMTLEKINRQIADVEANPDKYEVEAMTNSGHSYIAKTPHDHLLELYDRLISVADCLRKMNVSLTEANRTRLAMAKMAKEQAASLGPKKVAAWTSESRPAPSETQEVEVATNG